MDRRVVALGAVEVEVASMLSQKMLNRRAAEAPHHKLGSAIYWTNSLLDELAVIRETSCGARSMTSRRVIQVAVPLV